MNVKTWDEIFHPDAESGRRPGLEIASEVKDISGGTGGRGTIIQFRASTAVKDRDQEMIDPAGWFWRAMLPNQIYCHDPKNSDNWIGKGLAVEKSPDALLYTTELYDQYPGPKGETARFVAWIARTYPESVGCSVGFLPKKWRDPNGGIFTVDNPEGSYPWSVPGRKYLEQELLENSIAPVQSNYEALAVQVRSFFERSGAKSIFAPTPVAPAAPAAPAEPLDRLKALAEELGIELSVEEYDPAWLRLGVKRPLARPLVKVVAASAADTTELHKVWDQAKALGEAATAVERALGAVLGSATPAGKSQAA